MEQLLNELKDKININITEEDIKNDTELEIHSSYGGHLLKTIRVSEALSFINKCQLRPHIDYFINRKSDEFMKW